MTPLSQGRERRVADKPLDAGAGSVRYQRAGWPGRLYPNERHSPRPAVTREALVEAIREAWETDPKAKGQFVCPLSEIAADVALKMLDGTGGGIRSASGDGSPVRPAAPATPVACPTCKGTGTVLCSMNWGGVYDPCPDPFHAPPAGEERAWAIDKGYKRLLRDRNRPRGER